MNWLFGQEVFSTTKSKFSSLMNASPALVRMDGSTEM